jgi:hypothetical protein
VQIKGFDERSEKEHNRFRSTDQIMDRFMFPATR